MKIKIPLPKDNLYRGDAEWVWAEDQGDATYIIRNVPFFAKGLSFDDVVRAENIGGVLTLKDVVKRGGHSTYRVFAPRTSPDSEVRELLHRLEEMHCDVERADDKLVAIDVLPGANINEVYRELEKAESAGLIDFQEGHCGHSIKS